MKYKWLVVIYGRVIAVSRKYDEFIFNLAFHTGGKVWVLIENKGMPYYQRISDTL
jgi:hypothetical protein